MKKSFLLCSVFLLFPAYIAHADTYLNDELRQIKEDIVVLQRQLYRERADMDAPKESVSDFHVRFGEYDQLIRDMNGKVESIEYRLNTLEKKLDSINADIDLRFSQMQKHLETSPSLDNNTKGKNKETSNHSKTSIKETPKELYDSAQKDLNANKLADAEKKFSQFLSSYPKDNLAGNAQYWLGEVYYKQRNFAKAAVAFKDGYSNYPKGVKGPDCLLKLGLSMKALGKKEEACTAFVNLPTVFSNVGTNISSRAKKEAEELQCK